MPIDPGSRYYQLVLIQLKDPVKFGRYLELLRPVVQRYGGALERMVAPEAIYADAMPKPDILNLVFYDNRDAFTSFNQDPEFQKIVHLRSESIDMAAVGGLPLGGSVTQGGLDRRVYCVEVARYGAPGAEGYRRYEEEVEPIMARYGYHVERTLSPDSASGFPFKPDVVKVAYFESKEGMERMHQDPAHPRIERELYPAAVQQSVWVIGRVHPSTLQAWRA